MNSNPLYHANIDVPVYFDDFEPLSDRFEERRSDLEKINKDFIEWLSTMNLSIARCMFFTSPPGKVYNIHLDGDPWENIDVAHAKINIIFNSLDSYMSWYRARPGFENGVTYNNTRGIPNRYWMKKDCEELYKVPVNSHCIINGGVMHDLTNSFHNQGNRRCYSLIIKDLKSNKWLKWNELVERISPYIVWNTNLPIN
jgi:hypothetical protein